MGESPISCTCEHVSTPGYPSLAVHAHHAWVDIEIDEFLLSQAVITSPIDFFFSWFFLLFFFFFFSNDGAES